MAEWDQSFDMIPPGADAPAVEPDLVPEPAGAVLDAVLARGFGRAEALGRVMLDRAQGLRLRDLAAGMVDLIERGLDQREAALRSWAEEAALRDALAGSPAAAARRLGAALACYGGLRDVWLSDPAGRVVARGRHATDADAGPVPSWFVSALAGGGVVLAWESGGDGGMGVTLAVAVRDPVRETVLGVLAVRLDWLALAATVVGGAHRRQDPAASTRCLLIDRERRVLAASDGPGAPGERFPLTGGGAAGFYTDPDGVTVGYARGRRGWYGIAAQRPRDLTRLAH